MKQEQILVDKTTLLFLLDKVEECYYEECKKIVDKLLGIKEEEDKEE